MPKSASTAKFQECCVPIILVYAGRARLDEARDNSLVLAVTLPIPDTIFSVNVLCL
jgi:hypothetical protein